MLVAVVTHSWMDEYSMSLNVVRSVRVSVVRSMRVSVVRSVRVFVGMSMAVSVEGAIGAEVRSSPLILSSDVQGLVLHQANRFSHLALRGELHPLLIVIEISESVSLGGDIVKVRKVLAQGV